MSAKRGICYLVGAGPGDLGLVTLRARELIERADAIVFDNLANPEMLAWARDDAELVYAGKIAGRHILTQDEINARIVEFTRRGLAVVRLKGGDPFVFGRGGEEAQELRAAGCEFEIVPGITSAAAASAYAGIPLTHRDFCTNVTLVTGHEDPDKPASRLYWEHLARTGGTLAIYMGMERIAALMEILRTHGRSPDEPVAVIQRGTTGRHRSVTGTLATIAGIAEAAGLKAPAMIVVGGVVSLQPALAWFEQRPLLGQTVLLTRTRAQASRLRALLSAQGAEVWELPTIRISALPVPAAELARAASAEWLVFTSPNGVDYFFKAYLERNDIRTLAGVKVACVGPATAARLRERGIQPDWIPASFTAAELARSWPGEAKGLAVFACGNLAGPEVEEGLSAKGLTVARLEVYRTEPETGDRTRVRERMASEGVDWVVFASSSAAESFHALQLSVGPRPVRYASLGPVTAETMRRLGYPVDVQAPESTMESLVSALVAAVRKEGR